MMTIASHFRRSCRIRLCVSVLAWGVADLTAQTFPTSAFEPPPEARAIAERLRAMAPTTSADGTIRVAGESLDALDRMELLRFVADVRTRFEKLTGATFQGRCYGIALFVPTTDEERPASISRKLVPPPADEPGMTTPPSIQLTVVNLAKLDPRDLTCALCDGLLRMKVVEAAAGGTSLRPPPRWFAEGLGHYLEASRRQDDAESVLDLWRQAALPPLDRLAAARSPYASADRRIAAQLAAYWLDFPERGARLDRLCRALASGEPWSPGLFVETSSGIEDRIDADEDFDRWLIARRYAVLTPGVTRREFVVRAWRGLLLFPGEDRVPPEIPAGSPPSLLLDRQDEPWTRDCARAKAQKLMVMAAGRGATFQAAAAAWAEYFDGVARGERPAKLVPALQRAEKLLRDSATTMAP